MLTLHKLAFLVFVFWDEDFPAIDRVTDGKPKQASDAFEAFGLRHLPDLFGVKIVPQTVSRWCTNDMQPSVEKLYAISKHLKIDVRELLVPTKWS